MTLRVLMVSLQRARELGDAIGMPERRTTSEAFCIVANNPGVARGGVQSIDAVAEE